MRDNTRIKTDQSSQRRIIKQVDCQHASIPGLLLSLLVSTEN
jgi:hypothetical protein